MIKPHANTYYQARHKIGLRKRKRKNTTYVIKIEMHLSLTDKGINRDTSREMTLDFSCRYQDLPRGSFQQP